MGAMCSRGRSCCFIDKVDYDYLESPAIPIEGCVKNWFNIWFPRISAACLLSSFIVAVAVNAVFGNYSAFGAYIWMLILAVIYMQYKNFIPCEMKVDGSNIYVKMGTCHIQPFVKLTNARIRKVQKLDLMSCKWPRCWCDEQLRGLNWAEYEADPANLTCLQGDWLYGCKLFPAYVFIVPRIEGVDSYVTSQLHNA